MIAIIIVAIVVGGLIIDHIIDSWRAVQLAKHGCRELRDGRIVKL